MSTFAIKIKGQFIRQLQMIINLRKLDVSEEKIQQAIKMAEKDAA
ncbi:MAG: hypothetical protein QMC67_14545 [Candidatus Wallbacteria bacterium]